MVRPALRAVALLVFACAPTLTAHAQQLPRLHVDALGLHADRSIARIGTVIHLTIHVHVLERLDRLDNVVLPDLTNLQILGDERRIHADASGTDYVETLSVTAQRSGIAHASPAHLDAIDARNGRPTRFSSNDLTIRIEPETGTIDPLRNLLEGVRRVLIAITAIIAAFVVAVLGYARFFRPRRATPPARPAPVAIAAPDPRAQLATALAELRARPSRAGAVAARRALRDLARADEAETLETVLARLDGSASGLRAALRLAERAAFVSETRLHASIEDLIAALERLS